MEVELTVLERLVLSGLLPKEGNFTNLKLVRQLKEELSFNDIENQKLKFIQEGDQVKWNMVEGEKVRKKVTFADDSIMKETIIKELKKLNDDKKLRDEHFTLYEKFISSE